MYIHIMYDYVCCFLLSDALASLGVSVGDHQPGSCPRLQSFVPLGQAWADYKSIYLATWYYRRYRR